MTRKYWRIFQRRMKYLGISEGFDAAWAVVEDETVEVATHSEGYSYKRG